MSSENLLIYFTKLPKQKYRRSGVFLTGGGNLCYTTQKVVIAVPGNRDCAGAIEWLLRV